MIMQGLHYDLDSLFPENPDFLQEEDICRKDQEQLKRLYPVSVREYIPVLEEYLDRYEYDGSPIFDEYPDEVTICKMTDEVCESIYVDDGADMVDIKNIIQIMMCNDIYIRRRRHDRFTRMFRRRSD